mmetsp:Transcript_29350/g.93962  ORF Transcript_29350/g.93962 Transcript_29350/m.93962 type:complete len:297 (-) Transcript_29350:496-1386(-)
MLRAFRTQLSIATAVMFCHRYFVRQSLAVASNDRFIIGTACVFLAGKVEETPKKLSFVVEVSFHLRYRRDQDMIEAFKTNEKLRDHYKDTILQAERVLLHTLGFDFHIQHPYKHILKGTKLVESDSPQVRQDVAQFAWNFVNDSLCAGSTLCLEYPPNEIAASAIYLATKFQKVKLKDEWYKEVGVDVSICDEISGAILNLYDNQQNKKKQAELKGSSKSVTNGGGVHAKTECGKPPPAHVKTEVVPDTKLSVKVEVKAEAASNGGVKRPREEGHGEHNGGPLLKDPKMEAPKVEA